MRFEPPLSGAPPCFDAPRRLTFDAGTLVLDLFGGELSRRETAQVPLASALPLDDRLRAFFVWDPRIAKWRADALHYAAIRSALRENDAVLLDDADHSDRWFWPAPPLVAANGSTVGGPLRPEQLAAVAAWEASLRGSLVMPTGSGKTNVALEIIRRAGIPTLVVAPLRGLVSQWSDRLQTVLGFAPGVLGDDRCDVRPVTIATFASAALHMERIGNRFGLLVVDECHRFGGPVCSDAARMCIACKRLGLTATWPTATAARAKLESVVGPVVYSLELSALRGKTLADYETIRIATPLANEERALYDLISREIRQLVLRYGKAWSRRPNWVRVRIAALQGRLRRIEQLADSKIDAVVELLRRHADSPTIVFTNANDVAIELSRRLLLPALLGPCGRKERARVLAGLASGEFPAVIANRILDEGIDLPAVKVAIVVGGTALTCQATQRLGRLLRKQGSARAVLYELVADRTTEVRQSRRRRACHAYQGTRHRRL